MLCWFFLFIILYEVDILAMPENKRTCREFDLFFILSGGLYYAVFSLSLFYLFSCQGVKGSQSWGETWKGWMGWLAVRSRANSKVGKLPFKKKLFIIFGWAGYLFLLGLFFFLFTMKQSLLLFATLFIFYLKDNYFTEFCCFLSNLNMNQP